MNLIPRSTLVPASLTEDQDPGCFLRVLFPDLPEDATTAVVDLPQYKAVLVYEDKGEVPPVAGLISALGKLEDHNRIVACLKDGVLHLAVAEDGTLLLANAYPAPDFTTAEYYIFLAMKSLQLNPEQSVIRFASPLDEDQEISLGRYFKAVEEI